MGGGIDMDQNQIKRSRRSRGFFREERGAAMLEFVFVAPILCYLMIAVAWFHHQIDYAQDSIVRFRNQTWTRVSPGRINIRDANSDDDDFGAVSVFGINLGGNIRTGVQMAPLRGMSGSGMGTMLAGERYYNLGIDFDNIGNIFSGSGFSNMGTPYEAIACNRDNYFSSQTPLYPIPDNTWEKPLGNLAHFYGNKKFGGGPPQDLAEQADWEDAYPMVVDPWMRKLDRREFIQLALTSNMAAEIAYTGLSVFTFGLNTKDWTLQRCSNSYAADDGFLGLGGQIGRAHV
jgi:hypothetical protein